MTRRSRTGNGKGTDARGNTNKQLVHRPLPSQTAVSDDDDITIDLRGQSNQSDCEWILEKIRKNRSERSDFFRSFPVKLAFGDASTTGWTEGMGWMTEWHPVMKEMLREYPEYNTELSGLVNCLELLSCFKEFTTGCYHLACVSMWGDLNDREKEARQILGKQLFREEAFPSRLKKERFHAIERDVGKAEWHLFNVHKLSWNSYCLRLRDNWPECIHADNLYRPDGFPQPHSTARAPSPSARSSISNRLPGANLGSAQQPGPASSDEVSDYPKRISKNQEYRENFFKGLTEQENKLREKQKQTCDWDWRSVMFSVMPNRGYWDFRPRLLHFIKCLELLPHFEKLLSSPDEPEYRLSGGKAVSRNCFKHYEQLLEMEEGARAVLGIYGVGGFIPVLWKSVLSCQDVITNVHMAAQFLGDHKPSLYERYKTLHCDRWATYYPNHEVVM